MRSSIPDLADGRALSAVRREGPGRGARGGLHLPAAPRRPAAGCPRPLPHRARDPRREGDGHRPDAGRRHHGLPPQRPGASGEDRLRGHGEPRAAHPDDEHPRLRRAAAGRPSGAAERGPEPLRGGHRAQQRSPDRAGQRPAHPLEPGDGELRPRAEDPGPRTGAGDGRGHPGAGRSVRGGSMSPSTSHRSRSSSVATSRAWSPW